MQWVLLILMWFVVPLVISRRTRQRPHSRFIVVGFLCVSVVLFIVMVAPR